MTWRGKTDKLPLTVFLEVWHKDMRTIIAHVDGRGWCAWRLADDVLWDLKQGSHVAIPKPFWLTGYCCWHDSPRQCLQEALGVSASQCFMSRTDARILQYHDKPYMRHLTNEEMAERFNDVISIPMTLTSDGKVGIVSPESSGPEIFAPEVEKITDVFEECRYRYGGDYHPPEDQIRRPGQVPIPSNISESASSSMQELDRILQTSPTKAVLAKFGDSRYMRPMYESGKLRMTPASFYDAEQNAARQDDERRIELNIYQGDRKVLRHWDYWTFCMSRCTQDPKILFRLFQDFDADSCVLIRDEAWFFHHLHQLCRLLIPHTTTSLRPVQYIDPLLDNIDSTQIPTSKHLRFMYQHEVRMVAVPKRNRMRTEKLRPVDLCLGPMHEHATYIGP